LHYRASGIIAPVGGHLAHTCTCFEHMCSSSGGQNCITQPLVSSHLEVAVSRTPVHVSSTCAHHQEVKIALHSLWYHHTCRWPSRAHLYMFRAHVLIIRRSKLHYTASGIITPLGGHLMHRLHFNQSSLNLCTRRPPIGVMIPEAL